MGVLHWLRKNLLLTTEPDDGSQVVMPQPSLDDNIAAIAALRNPLALQESARLFVQYHGPDVIPALTQRFDRIGEPPSSFTARERSACAWATCWWGALYEILFQYRAQALPALRTMAHAGNYTAIVLLCRLAAEGIERPQIMAELRALPAELAGFGWWDVAAQLLSPAQKDPALGEIVAELRQLPDFERAVVEAQQAAD